RPRSIQPIAKVSPTPSPIIDNRTTRKSTKESPQSEVTSSSPPISTESASIKKSAQGDDAVKEWENNFENSNSENLSPQESTNDDSNISVDELIANEVKNLEDEETS